MKRGLFVVFCLVACGEDRPREERPRLPSAEEIRAELAPLSFDDFIDRSFLFYLARSPEQVIDLGLEDQVAVGQSFVDDVSLDFQQQTQAIETVILERARAFEEGALTSMQALTREVYVWYFDDRVRGHPYTDLEYRITPTINSVHLGTELFFTDVHPLENAQDAENYAARLSDAGLKIEAARQAMERAAAAGVYTPRVLLEQARFSVKNVVLASPRGTRYYQTLFDRLPADADREVLDRAEEAITDSLQPAYRALDETIGVFLLGAPEEPGVGQHPRGAEYYAWTLRHHITTETTAPALHELGLAELSRIHGELRERFDALGYPANETIAQGIARAAADGGSVPRAMVVGEYDAIIEDAERRLAEVFSRKPSAKVIVKGGSFGGVYVGASLDKTRPAAFFAFVPSGGELRFGMRTLAYHETVPGHHLQVGLAQDLELPLFQRLANFTGFTEGWALYAEKLAEELGWYAEDPHGDIGRLQAEAFRAARLVVDTGLHDRHWSFDQATEFMQENLGFSRGAALEQVGRYASWPGQATAYYTGMSKIRALKETWPHDQKSFHDAVLLHGSLPLEVLESVVANAR